SWDTTSGTVTSASGGSRRSSRQPTRAGRIWGDVSTICTDRQLHLAPEFLLRDLDRLDPGLMEDVEEADPVHPGQLSRFPLRDLALLIPENGRRESHPSGQPFVRAAAERRHLVGDFDRDRLHGRTSCSEVYTSAERVLPLCVNRSRCAYRLM